MWRQMKSWWTRRIIPTLPTLQVITRFLWGIFLVVAILIGFKFIFYTSCLTVGSVKACVTSTINSSDTLFAIGGILVAIVALIPTFWIDGKIRDAKKEVGQQIFEEVRENMQRLSNAQMLIFEADKYQNVGELLSKEVLIEQALNLWPSFKQERYKKLGDSFSSAVMGGFYQGLGRGTNLYTGASLNREQIRLYLSKAISYLEETIQNSEVPSREELVNLACMYGCAARYDDMIRAIERAIKVDENVKDDFQEDKKLSLLIYACRTNRQRIEKLGRKIGKELPLSKVKFVNIINKVDLRNRTTYIIFTAVRRQPVLTDDYVYDIKISAADNQGQRLVSGMYLTIIKGQDSHDIPKTIGQQVSIEDFFDEVDKELYIICSSDE
ncbi:MAG TPA: hypothetical protein VEP90_09735 [Methylomirabilota bacterium]|nr:hypothetical protein [Methylomirabilota bacterium]